MELNKKDYLVNLYKDVFHNLPTNICSYFWGLLFIFAHMLTSVSGLVQLFISNYNYQKNKRYSGEIIIGLTYLERLLQVFYGIVYSESNFTITNYLILDYILLLSILVIAFIILIYIVFNIQGLLEYIVDKISNVSKPVSPKKPNIIKTYFKSFKNKYCELITYK